MLPYAFNQLRQAALNYQLNAGAGGHPVGPFTPGPNPYAGALNPYAALDPLLGYRAFGPRFIHEEPKPQHSYIGLIAMGILSSAEKKMVLSDIYQWILDNYSYFRNRGPGWRNSIRHNLSLNDCFIKAGRSANGKGHYWAIHPANIEDFKKGDFRRRRAQRKVRKHMGLAVPDDDEDSDESPCVSPVAGQTTLTGITSSTATPICPPPLSFPPTHISQNLMPSPPIKLSGTQISPETSSRESSGGSSGGELSPRNCAVPLKKRNFDVESLLAPDAKVKKPKMETPETTKESSPVPPAKEDSTSPPLSISCQQAPKLSTSVQPSVAPPPQSQIFNPLALSPTAAAKFGLSAAHLFPFGFPMSPVGGLACSVATNPWATAFPQFANLTATHPANFTPAAGVNGQKTVPPAPENREDTPSPNGVAQWQETFAKIMARSYQGRQHQLFQHQKAEPDVKSRTESPN